MPAVTERKTILERELNTWMTKELSATGIRKGSQILMKAMLPEQDETGCNWSADVHLSGGFNTLIELREVVRPATEDIVRRARAQFNVARK
jgi:hypothetical protein